MKRLYCLLFIFFSSVFCNYIFAAGGYDFDRMWPVLEQPWYFNQPRGIAIDSSGNVHVADTDNHRIQKFISSSPPITNPTISVSLTTLDFGEVVIGQSKSLTFTITDTASTNNLTGTISDDQDWITTDKTAFSGNSTTVNVTVNTAGKSKAQFTGNITITPTSANSGSVQTITVKVSPTCVIPSPNPFRPGAGKKLTFRGNGVSNGTIWIYTLSGELVKTLIESVGFHELEWDGEVRWWQLNFIRYIFLYCD